MGELQAAVLSISKLASNIDQLVKDGLPMRIIIDEKSIALMALAILIVVLLAKLISKKFM